VDLPGGGGGPSGKGKLPNGGGPSGKGKLPNGSGPPSGRRLSIGSRGRFPVRGTSVPFGFPWSSSPWNPWYPLWYPPQTATNSFIKKIIIVPNLFYWDRFECSCSSVSESNLS
jgi:hypothetical protein